MTSELLSGSSPVACDGRAEVNKKISGRLMAALYEADPSIRPLLDAVKGEQIRLALMSPDRRHPFVFNPECEGPTIFLAQDGDGGPNVPPESYPGIAELLEKKRPPVLVYGSDEEKAGYEFALTKAMAVGSLLIVSVDTDRMMRWARHLSGRGLEVSVIAPNEPAILKLLTSSTPIEGTRQ